MKQVTPFSISPNPNSLYLTDSLSAVVQKTRFTIDNRQGLTCIFGDVGLGKSTVLRFLFSEYLAREDIKAILIPTPNFPTPFSLLKSICEDLRIEPARSLQAQQRGLQSFLVGEFAAERNVILFIDEAQNLDNRQLEMIRSILNFETDTEKLVQIVLAGQLELITKLYSKKNKPLRSRVSTRSDLNPLTLDESKSMIEYRCKVHKIDNPFTDSVITEIYTHTGGVPRSVLKLCALLYESKTSFGISEIPIEIVGALGLEVAL